MSDFAGERTYTQEEVDKLLDKYIAMTYEVLEALHDIKEGSETQLTLHELRNKIFYEAEVTYKPTTVSSPNPEQVVKIGLDDLMHLFTQALTSFKSEMEKKKPIKDWDADDGFCQTCDSYLEFDDKYTCYCDIRRETISECQRVIEEWGKK